MMSRTRVRRYSFCFLTSGGGFTAQGTREKKTIDYVRPAFCAYRWCMSRLSGRDGSPFQGPKFSTTGLHVPAAPPLEMGRVLRVRLNHCHALLPPCPKAGTQDLTGEISPDWTRAIARVHFGAHVQGSRVGNADRRSNENENSKFPGNFGSSILITGKSLLNQRHNLPTNALAPHPPKTVHATQQANVMMALGGRGCMRGEEGQKGQARVRCRKENKHEPASPAPTASTSTANRRYGDIWYTTPERFHTGHSNLPDPPTFDKSEPLTLTETEKHKKRNRSIENNHQPFSPPTPRDETHRRAQRISDRTHALT